MIGGWEPRHIYLDFGDDRLGCQLTNSRSRYQRIPLTSERGVTVESMRTFNRLIIKLKPSMWASCSLASGVF